MFSQLRLVAASAASAELAILRTAPVLLESLAQLQHSLTTTGAVRTLCTDPMHPLPHPTACTETGSTAPTVPGCINSASTVTNPSVTNSSCTYRHFSSSKGGSSNSAAGEQASEQGSDSKIKISKAAYLGKASNIEQRLVSHYDIKLSKQDSGAYRIGFGSKVAMPSIDDLREVLVGEDATIEMRAYHIGARIHIGQVLQRAKQEGCRTNSGKDYCIIWLNANKAKPQQGSRGSGSASSSDASSSYMINYIPNRDLQKKVEKVEKYILSLYSHLPQASKQRKDAVRIMDKRRTAMLGSVPSLRKSAALNLGDSGKIDPILVVYRYGSVVFAGTQPNDEPGLVDEYIPNAVRYKPGGDSTWAQPNPMLVSRSPVDKHTIKVVPSQADPASKGTDQMLLRVLDLGGLRVLTSVLAQSAALKFYEISVAEAIDKLARFRSHVRNSKQPDLGWIGSLQTAVASWSKEEETTYFKVIAASALVINEARELLEMAEPAWQYDAYHSIWRLTADDFDLEGRFKSLELKLRQVEKEAKYDVKDKAGRRYHRLEQSVVWLLVASCLIAAVEVGRKALEQRGSRGSTTAAGGMLHGSEASAAESSLNDATSGNDDVDFELLDNTPSRAKDARSLKAVEAVGLQDGDSENGDKRSNVWRSKPQDRMDGTGTTQQKCKAAVDDDAVANIADAALAERDGHVQSVATDMVDGMYEHEADNTAVANSRRVWWPWRGQHAP